MLYSELVEKLEKINDELEEFIEDFMQKDVYPKKKDLITMDDIDQLIDACDDLRDKTIIAVLWDTGMRVGELINLNVGSIVFLQDFEMYYSVPSMGGNRRIYTHVHEMSYDYVYRFIEYHPYKKDKTKPLFCNKDGLRIKPDEIQNVLVLACNTINLQKSVTPIIIRQSRAMELRKFMTDEELRVRFGWIDESRTLSKIKHQKDQHSRP